MIALVKVSLVVLALAAQQAESVHVVKSNDIVHMQQFTGNTRRLASVQYVCAFDVDRTLTAAQQSTCGGNVRKDVIDNAYGGQNLPLMEGQFAAEAIKACASKGYGISILTHGAGCSVQSLDGAKSKFDWLANLISTAIGKTVATSEWKETNTPGALQCGGRSKDLMMAEVQAFWNVPYSNIVFYDDQQSNLDVVKKSAKTSAVVVQLASMDRGSDTCTTLTSHCCGLNKKEFDLGMTALMSGGGGGSGSTTTSPSGSPTTSAAAGGGNSSSSSSSSNSSRTSLTPTTAQSTDSASNSSDSSSPTTSRTSQSTAATTMSSTVYTAAIALSGLLAAMAV